MASGCDVAGGGFLQATTATDKPTTTRAAPRIPAVYAARPSPGEARKRLPGPREQVPLQEIALELHELLPLGLRLDPLGHHLDAELVTQRGHRADQFLLRGACVDVPHQGHVELDDLRFKRR